MRSVSSAVWVIGLAWVWVACSAQGPGTGSRPSSRPTSNEPGKQPGSHPAAGQPTDAAAGPNAGSLHAAFDTILAATVRNERVDYLALRRDHWSELLGYLTRLERTDPAGLERDARLAYYLNLYNATMIRAVIERLTADYSPADAEYGIFKEPLAKAGGRTLTLDEIENKIVRPEFDEPRIHTALVCGAVSCPPLLPRAYRADDLDEVLEANMRRFLNDRSRNRVDVAGRKLALSSIFKWYADDFGGESGLAAYVDRYVDAEVSGFEVSFLDYSWKLNIAPPAKGRFVTVTGADVDAKLRRGGIYEVLDELDDQLRVAVPFGQQTVRVPESATQPFVVQ